MIRKIYISGLVLILLVSTTGLTFTLHICKMMNEDETELCKMEHMKIMHSCCPDDDDNGQKFSSSQPDCCEFQTVNRNISDQFLSFEVNTNKDNNITVSIVDSEIFSLKLFDSNRVNSNVHNNSPPGRQNRLFIINSSFLI